MASNKRVFWACTGVSFCTHGTILDNGAVDTTGCTPAYGVQSVGITTNFNLEQVFELGQIAIYENVEEVPDIEITIEKVLDAEPLLYDLATSPDGVAANTTGLDVDMVLRAQDRKDVWFTVQDESNNYIAHNGSHVYCSGMYVSSFSYTLPNEGNCTESLTLVGNDKLWKTGSAANDPVGPDARMAVHAIDVGDWGNADFDEGDNSDTPGGLGAIASLGVMRRENVKLSACEFPLNIQGIQVRQVGNLDPSGPEEDVHLASITISGDLGRESINELGRKLPYYRYVTFPVEVSTDIEVTTVSGDLVDAGSHKDNLSDERIFITLDDTTTFDCGTHNKLQSVTYTGGSTGGENATCTYSYLGFNEFVVNGPA